MMFLPNIYFVVDIFDISNLINDLCILIVNYKRVYKPMQQKYQNKNKDNKFYFMNY